MIFEKQIVGAYRAMAYTRCDDNGTARYFSAEDFAGLHRESYRFRASAGNTLQGYFYCYDNPMEGRLIIFDHGLGGGHRSYLREIEMLCRHGYRVFAYDHTGCMESEGETTNGMSQSLRDLNDCITALKSDAGFANVALSVMGHSWGGFSALNISALHPDLSHIVVLSGFVSVELLINSYFGGFLKGYRRAVMRLERDANPDFVGYHALESLSKTSAKVLLIYSENDRLCRRDPHYTTLEQGLRGRENVELLLLPNKGHNPNYTEDAVRYLGEYSAARAKLTRKRMLETEEQKKAFRESWDWDRMTAQDTAVWDVILRCLDA